MTLITLPEITALATLYTEGHSCDEIRWAVGITLTHLRNAGSANVALIDEVMAIVSGPDLTSTHLINEVSDEIGQLFSIQAKLGKVVAPIHMSFMATFAVELIRTMVPEGFTAPGFDEAVQLNIAEAEDLMALA